MTKMRSFERMVSLIRNQGRELLRGQTLSCRIQRQDKSVGSNAGQQRLSFFVPHPCRFRFFDGSNLGQSQIAKMMKATLILPHEGNETLVFRFSDKKQMDSQSLISILGASLQSRSKL